MKFFTKKNADYTRGERIMTALIAFNIFAVIGAAVRVFNGPVALGSTRLLIEQFLPMMLFFGLTAAILAYFFPKVFQIIMCFIPIPGGNS